MIEISNLYHRFKQEYLYEDFTITFQSEKINSVIGPSGCGKTTLLRIIAGLEPYEGGKIYGVKNNKLSFVFQEDRLLPWLTVKENIVLVIKDIPKMQADIGQIIKEILDLLKIDTCSDMMPNELSGGMQRRVAIGRALAYDLACDGQLILLDEPFKGLDEALKEEIMEALLYIWKKYKKTIILVTHDLKDASKLSDAIYEFYGSPVKWRIMNIE